MKKHVYKLYMYNVNQYVITCTLYMELHVTTMYDVIINTCNEVNSLVFFVYLGVHNKTTQCKPLSPKIETIG